MKGFYPYKNSTRCKITFPYCSGYTNTSIQPEHQKRVMFYIEQSVG